MRIAYLVLPLLAVTAPSALANGNLRGNAAGAVAGHYVGKGHAVAGAMAGCAAMHYHYAKKAAQQKAAAR